MLQMYAVSFFTAIPFYIYNNECRLGLARSFPSNIAYPWSFLGEYQSPCRITAGNHQ
jgi:hypothetical protein